jgi:hypothetical protein
VQLRWGAYGAGEPNAVVTSYASHALLDLARVGSIPTGAQELVAAAVDLATKALHDHDGYFVYCKGSRVAIHNANLLVASFVGRASAIGSSERELASRAVAYTLERQRPDGSWPYGEGPSLGWVDGFHTAYVLERLVQWHAVDPDPAVSRAISRGAAYFIERLLDPDGAPRATSSSRYPIESHAAASAVTALSMLGEYEARALPRAELVLSWALARLRRRDGRFVFRRGRLLSNRVAYIRWSDAHMLLALANYLSGACA